MLAAHFPHCYHHAIACCMFRCCSRYCCCCSFFPSFHYLFAYWTLLIIILLFWYQATKMRETRRKPHKWNASLPVVCVCVCFSSGPCFGNQRKKNSNQQTNKQTVQQLANPDLERIWTLTILQEIANECLEKIKMNYTIDRFWTREKRRSTSNT